MHAHLYVLGDTLQLYVAIIPLYNILVVHTSLACTNFNLIIAILYMLLIFITCIVYLYRQSFYFHVYNHVHMHTLYIIITST